MNDEIGEELLDALMAMNPDAADDDIVRMAEGYRGTPPNAEEWAVYFRKLEEQS